MQGKGFVSNFVTGIFVGGVILILIYIIPWQSINWGKIQFASERTITVTGEAKTQEKNQIATFTAGVSSVNDDKQTAVSEVNQKVEALIAAVKTFGIAGNDIKTQNLSIYQQEESYYEEGSQKSRPGQWRVNNSINITLRDIDRASELADLLTGSGATNVYGPNFSIDEAKSTDDLLAQAIDDAKRKAAIIAQSSGGKLGKIISVTEGYSSSPVFRAFEGMGGGGAPLQPGSQTVSQTITVVFELE